MSSGCSASGANALVWCRVWGCWWLVRSVGRIVEAMLPVPSSLLTWRCLGAPGP